MLRCSVGGPNGSCGASRVAVAVGVEFVLCRGGGVVVGGLREALHAEVPAL